MVITEWLLDYEKIILSFTVNLERNMEILSDDLPYEWARIYKERSPHKANIHRIKISSFEYLFDHSDELVDKGIIAKQEAVENRLVAVHGRSQAVNHERKDSILRRQPRGAIEFMESTGRGNYDRGHFIAHTLGGDLNINIFPQLTEVNRGWSHQGKLYRSMERYCQKNPGTYCFSRPLYSGQSPHPFAIEFGVLKADSTLWVNIFPNTISTEEMAEIERLLREKLAL